MEIQELKQVSQTFFSMFGAELESLEVQEEQAGIYRINLKTPDSHLIIGPHGKHLEHFGHILKLIFCKKLGKFAHLHLEVNDYLQEKDAKLFRFIDSKIEQVKQHGKEIMLPEFTAYERKKVHSYVAEKGGRIYTESRGEGTERRIYLCQTHEKMTIDLDGDDI